MRIHLKMAKKCCLYLDIFSCVKINILCSFCAFRLEMPVRYDNRYKTGAGGENYFGTVDAVWVHGYLRFEPGAWKWNEGLSCLFADCKILISLIFFKYSYSILDWTAVSWNFGGILETFLKGYLDQPIGAHLFTVVWPLSTAQPGQFC